ncbi:hypothetical protein [Paenibacillus graminis]|uniref:hypothetical protein n=1 Tax=Paenibacillus graminis TaxID=189425 RepID=UPI002DB63F67|nr:hypothetical protein [Paenibacillus graminis]MEC0168667.1 hypothetical protein [Paenibacillus graminis]
MKIRKRDKLMEGKFGANGALASAFVCGFPPQTAVQIQEIRRWTAAQSPNIPGNNGKNAVVRAGQAGLPGNNTVAHI